MSTPEDSTDDEHGVEVLNRGDGYVVLRDSDGVGIEMTEEDARTLSLMALRSVDGDSVLLDAYERGQEAAEEYGSPKPNMTASAVLLRGYTDAPGLDAFNAAICMVLWKVARLKTGERKRDTLVDISGYARVAAEVEGMDDGW